MINLGQTVRVQPMPEERDRELPDWSEKIAHGILSGTLRLGRKHQSLDTICCKFPSMAGYYGNYNLCASVWH